jgi:two-component system phosphate regulon response regulator PhoB
MTGGPWRALVVEDEPAMRGIITFALETQDFATVTAGSAEEAWSLLRQQDVDLVVLDVMLPGMSGIDLCRRITQVRQVPVILLTALGEAAQRIAGLEAGAADYVAKPFHPRELALRAAGTGRFGRARGTDHLGPARRDRLCRRQACGPHPQ